MQRHLRDRETDLRPLRRHRKRRREGHRIDIGADAVEVVLREPDHVEAQLVREPRLAQGLVDHLTIARGITALRKQEIAEFHEELLRQASGATPTYWNWCTTSPIGAFVSYRTWKIDTIFDFMSPFESNAMSPCSVLRFVA